AGHCVHQDLHSFPTRRSSDLTWDLGKVDKDELENSQATLVFGQMNEPPGARARVALSGLTIAEYFRDGDGQGKGNDILFFIDNIDRKSTRLNSSHVKISYAVF